MEKKNQKVKEQESKKSSSKRAVSRSKKSPQTMEELLKQANYKFYGFKKGDVVEGIITEKTKKTIWVDIGTKTEGLILDKEIKAAKDFVEQLKVGDKVTVVVYQPESENGHPLLSFKKTLVDYLWQEFEEKLKTGEPIKVKGKEINRGGLLVDVKGVMGFIPASCFSSQYLGKLEALINRQFEARIIEEKKKKNRLILSEKALSEGELIKEQEKLLSKIKVGEIYEGKVTGIMPFGLFVKIEVPLKTKETKKQKEKKTKKTATSDSLSLEGLVHISEISWEKIEDPSKLFKQNDKVKVKVLGIEKKSGKLNFSLKQLQPDPWEDIEKKYPLDAKVKGEVVRVAPFGAFVNLDKGIEGLIHISKIPAERSLKVGEKVDCFVESIDKEARKMSLGLVLKEKPVGYK